MTQEQFIEFEENLAKQEDPIIILKSVYKGTRHTVQPAFDPDLNWYAGVERLSPEDKRHRSYYVEPTETKIKLRDGYEFDLSNDVDATNWKWVSRLRVIESSFEAAQSSEEAMFYVHIEGREAQKNISRHARIFEAQKFIFEDNPENYLDRALILGQDFTGEHPSNVKEWLLNRAKDKPSEIIRLYNAKNTGLQLMFLKGKQKGFIKEDRDGVIKFENRVLGMGDDGAIAYLLSKDAAGIVELIRRRVYPNYSPDEVESTNSESTVPEIGQTVEGTQEKVTTPESERVNDLLAGSKD